MLSEVSCAACGTVTTYADLALQTPLESEDKPVAPSV
jgi:hypothetical protein